MFRFKKGIVFLIFVMIISVSFPSYADDHFEEELEISDMDMIFQTVTSEVKDEPKINARHAIIYDRTSGEILYGKKEKERCKMASTTKIMTALVVLEKTENLEEKVKVSAKAAGTGGSRLGLHKDDEISIKDLLYGLLLCSRK